MMVILVAVLWQWGTAAGDSTVSAITNKLIFDLIKYQYRPYDTHEEFKRGFAAYQSGNWRNPHDADSISARAWDRGVEAAMHYVRATA